MPIAYITTAEAKEFSRIQHAALDTTIGTLIEAASASVKNYLGDFSPYEGERNDDDDYVLDSNWEPQLKLDSNGLQVVKAEVKLAVMLLVDRWIKYQYSDNPVDYGYLPPEITSILYPLRDPVCK